MVYILKNPKTGKKISAKSSGTRDRTKTEYLAHKWLFEGIPNEKTCDPRNPEEIFKFDELLFKLKNTTIEDRDIPQIINVLKKRNLIDDAKIGRKSEKSVPFLLRFWDF